MLVSPKFTYLEGARDMNNPFWPPEMAQNRDFSK